MSLGGVAPSVGRAVEKASVTSFQGSPVFCQTTASHSNVTKDAASARPSTAR